MPSTGIETFPVVVPFAFQFEKLKPNVVEGLIVIDATLVEVCEAVLDETLVINVPTQQSAPEQAYPVSVKRFKSGNAAKVALEGAV